MKNKTVAYLAGLLIFFMVLLPACKNDAVAADADGTADFTNVSNWGFMLLWDPGTWPPEGYEYRLTLSISETAGVAADILSITVKYTDTQLNTRSFTYSGQQWFGTDHFNAYQTLQTNYTQLVSYTELFLATNIDITFEIMDKNGHLITESIAYETPWF